MSNASENRKNKTRANIIRTAYGLFSKKGYHNTQVMDIVHAAGISAGTFYNHFTDKKKLYETMTREDFESMRTGLCDIRQSLNAQNAQDREFKVQESCRTYLEYVKNNPEQVLMILRSSFGIDTKLDMDAWESYSRCAKDISTDIRGWESQGIIQGANPDLVGHAIVGLSMQIAHAYLTQKPFTVEEAVDAMTTMILAIFTTYLTHKGEDHDP